MTITERVLAYLKDQPGDPVEIAKALGLTKRGHSYNWGKWSFLKAEQEGLIEYWVYRWHLKEVVGLMATKKTPGQAVTPEEVNYLITKIRDVRTALEANKRQLNMIDVRLGELEDTVEGFDVVDVVAHEEDKVV